MKYLTIKINNSKNLHVSERPSRGDCGTLIKEDCTVADNQGKVILCYLKVGGEEVEAVGVAQVVCARKRE